MTRRPNAPPTPTPFFWTRCPFCWSHAKMKELGSPALRCVEQKNYLNGLEATECNKRVWHFTSVWQLSPIKKTGSSECNRNLRRWDRKRGGGTTRPPEWSRTNCASLECLTLHCTCFLPCCSVVVVAVSNQMLLFIQLGLVKIPLFYYPTMFHCETLPRRQNITMCAATENLNNCICSA